MATLITTLPLRTVVRANEHFTGVGLMHHTQHRLLAIEQRDEHPPMQHAGYECTCAIDGIDDPCQAVARLEAMFLAKNSVFWISRLNALPNDRLCRFVSDCNRVETAALILVFNDGIAAKMGQRGGSGALRQIDSEVQIFIAFAPVERDTLSVPKFHCFGLRAGLSHRPALEPAMQRSYDAQLHARSISMNSQFINPPASKTTYDRFHFSQAVRVGDTLVCSGQLGLGSNGRPPADMTEEFRAAWRAVGSVLEAAGLGYGDIVEYTTFHVGLQATLAAFMKARDEFLHEPWPAWTAIGITELAVPGAHVEIRVTARKAQ
jgi:enamine deaminase RidA (YjgF/YER057c/UK114 family)